MCLHVHPFMQRGNMHSMLCLLCLLLQGLCLGGMSTPHTSCRFEAQGVTSLKVVKAQDVLEPQSTKRGSWALQQCATIKT